MNDTPTIADQLIEAAADNPASFEERLLTTDETARIVGLAPNTLAKARMTKGPSNIPHVKIGRAVRYSTRDIAMFIRNRTATSTAQA